MSEYEVKKYPDRSDEVDVNREVKKRVIAIIIAILSILAIVILIIVLIGKFSNTSGNKKYYYYNFENSSLTVDTPLEEGKYLNFESDSQNHLYKMNAKIWSNDPEIDLGPVGVGGAYIYHAKGLTSSTLFISFTIFDIKNETLFDKSLLSEVKYEIYVGQDNKLLLENFEMNNESYDVIITSENEIYLNSFSVGFYI